MLDRSSIFERPEKAGTTRESETGLRIRNCASETRCESETLYQKLPRLRNSASETGPHQKPGIRNPRASLDWGGGGGGGWGGLIACRLPTHDLFPSFRIPVLVSDSPVWVSDSAVLVADSRLVSDFPVSVSDSALVSDSAVLVSDSAVLVSNFFVDRKSRFTNGSILTCSAVPLAIWATNRHVHGTDPCHCRVRGEDAYDENQAIGSKLSEDLCITDALSCPERPLDCKSYAVLCAPRGESTCEAEGLSDRRSFSVRPFVQTDFVVFSCHSPRCERRSTAEPSVPIQPEPLDKPTPCEHMWFCFRRRPWNCARPAPRFLGLGMLGVIGVRGRPQRPADMFP